MPRSVKVATIQMDGSPAAIDTRLERAENLIEKTVNQGAELIVLPAGFNTGKTYCETNYDVTEQLTGDTIQWMCQQAEKHHVYMAGAMMVIDNDDTYNTAVLIAPDGKMWRYEQQYPYLWERVYYRDGYRITVADTALGKIGFMIGWDAAHPEIWERYAAKVDFLLIMHDALDTEQVHLQYRDGVSVEGRYLGFFANWLANTTANYLNLDVETQGNCLSVPIICAGASGEFKSILPAPFFSIQALFLGRPSLWERASNQYADMQLVAPFQRNTRILDANGNTLGRVISEGDGVVVSDIQLADKIPLPRNETQPEMSVSQYARWVVDLITNACFSLNYRRGVRRYWGAKMAPIDARTRVWFGILIVVAGLSALLTRILFPRKH